MRPCPKPYNSKVNNVFYLIGHRVQGTMLILSTLQFSPHSNFMNCISVLGRLLTWPPRFPPLSVHALYKPFLKCQQHQHISCNTTSVITYFFALKTEIIQVGPDPSTQVLKQKIKQKLMFLLPSSVMLHRQFWVQLVVENDYYQTAKKKARIIVSNHYKDLNSTNKQ